MTTSIEPKRTSAAKSAHSNTATGIHTHPIRRLAERGAVALSNFGGDSTNADWAHRVGVCDNNTVCWQMVQHEG
jgi:hypothetical protein